MKKTVSQLIAEGRSKAQRWDLGEIPDGYASEEGEHAKGITAMDIVRDLVQEMTATGFNQCWFSIPVVASQRDYMLSRRMGLIRRAILLQVSNNLEWPIYQTTQKYLDESMPGWNKTKSSRPTHFFYQGTKTVGIYPLPTTTGYTIKFLCDTPIKEPTEGLDVIGGVFDDSDVAVLDEDGFQASIVPEEMTRYFTSGIASRMARATGDWPTYGSFNKEWEKGLKMLTGMAHNRIDVDRDDMIIDVTGNMSNGVSPRW